jgi:hypothetical protein
MTGQVHKNFLYHNIHPHHVMTGAQEFFVPQHPPSLRDDRCTRILFHKNPPLLHDDKRTNIFFREVHLHHMITGTQEFSVQEGPPSSPDDRYTRTFCSQDIHPHHLMSGPQEFFVEQHPPLSRDDRCTRILFRHHMMTNAQDFFVPKTYSIIT